MKNRTSLNPHNILLLFAITAGILSACTGETTATETHNISAGKQIFTQQCAFCHSTQPEQIIVGPALAGLSSRAPSSVPGLDSRTYITSSIIFPSDYLVEGYQNIMPDSFQYSLSEEEISALVDYLLTL